MQWNARVLGIGLSVEATRSQTTTVLRIPPSQLLEQLRESPKGASGDDAERLWGSYAGRPFWEDDPGYGFGQRNLGRPGRILDLGCACGHLNDWLEHIGSKAAYVGVDVVPAFVEKARRAYPDATFHASDMAQGVPGGPFDLVWSKGSLCSTMTPYEALDATLRIPAARTLLVHTLVADLSSVPEPFLTAVVVRPDAAYCLTIMDRSRFDDAIAKSGARVVERQVRRGHTVLQFGRYEVHDLALIWPG